MKSAASSQQLLLNLEQTLFLNKANGFVLNKGDKVGKTGNLVCLPKLPSLVVCNRNLIYRENY